MFAPNHNLANITSPTHTGVYCSTKKVLLTLKYKSTTCLYMCLYSPEYWSLISWRNNLQLCNNCHIYYDIQHHLKTLCLYIDTLIIGHTLCSMLSKLIEKNIKHGIANVHDK